MKQYITVFFITLTLFTIKSQAQDDKELKMCLEQETLWKRNLKATLNSFKDSNSQRIQELKWNNYCPCYVKFLRAQPNPKGNIPRDEHIKMAEKMNQNMRTCAAAAGFHSPQIKKSKPTPRQDPYFEDKIKFCSTNGIGQTLLIEVELKSLKDPRIEKVRSLNLADYCRCYYNYLRTELGDMIAKQVANFESHKAPPEDLIKLNWTQQDATEACVAQQFPYPSLSNSITTTGSSVFEKIYSSTFEIGKGLGEIKIGLSVEKLNKLLGPIGVKTSRKDFDEYRYGPNLIELKVHTAPPGPHGKVTYIKVNYLFRGPISHGIKKGDLFETVIEKMKPLIPYAKDRHIGFLMYKEGMQFSFADYNKGTLQGLIAFEPSTHPLLKTRK